MKVTGFDNVERFRDFRMEKGGNEHSNCFFSFADYNVSDYAGKLDMQVKIIEDDCCLMTGKVAKVELIQKGVEHIVTVTVYSESYGWDLEKKTRVFQKQGQTYRDIVNQITDLGNMEVDISGEVKEQKLPGPLVQLNETDFSFLKRIAKDGFGKPLFVKNNNGKSGRCMVGSEASEIREVKDEELASLTAAFDLEGRKIEFTISGSAESQELRQYVDVGKIIRWNHQDYTIDRLVVQKTEGVYRFWCMARSEQRQKEQLKEIQPACLFHAKIFQNEDPDHYGRVLLDFQDTSNGISVEDMTKDDKLWHDVLTPYTANNGGIVFIPEKDDCVEAVWNGESFYVIGSRRTAELSEQYKDIQLKQIGNLHNKNICFSEEALELSSEESKVTLYNDKVQIEIPDSRVVVTKEEISVETKESKVLLNSDIVLDSGTVHIDADKLQNNIKNQYQCESKNIGLNASSVVKIEGKGKVSIN